MIITTFNILVQLERTTVRALELRHTLVSLTEDWKATQIKCIERTNQRAEIERILGLIQFCYIARHINHTFLV